MGARVISRFWHVLAAGSNLEPRVVPIYPMSFEKGERGQELSGARLSNQMTGYQFQIPITFGCNEKSRSILVITCYNPHLELPGADFL